MPQLVKKGSVLIFQMHYTTMAWQQQTGPVSASFSPKSRWRSARHHHGPGRARSVIPAGDPNYESRASFTFKEDSHIWVMPHMHGRGDYKYTLVLPDGSSKVLLNVPKYDFNWQLNYWLKTPVAAKGSRLECVAHHDNSVNNKYNPDPTKTVYWGDQTREEMMIGWFDYTVDSQDLRKETALLK